MRAFVLSLIAIALLGAAAPPSKDIRIIVNGESVVTRTPDVATVSLGIVTINDAEQNATSDNNRRYEDLRTRLHALGIADPSIRTTGFNVNYVAPDPSVPVRERPRSGYTVSRQVDVKLTNLDMVGNIIDQAVSAGVTDINNVTFTLSNERAVYAEALGSAVADAQRQAKAMASAANMRIVRIAGMQTGAMPLIGVVRPGVAADVYRATPTQIQPSNVDVHANVTVWYIIGP